jgi:hypothetical protein
VWRARRGLRSGWQPCGCDWSGCCPGCCTTWWSRAASWSSADQRLGACTHERGTECVDAPYCGRQPDPRHSPRQRLRAHRGAVDRCHRAGGVEQCKPCTAASSWTQLRCQAGRWPPFARDAPNTSRSPIMGRGCGLAGRGTGVPSIRSGGSRSLRRWGPFARAGDSSASRSRLAILSRGVPTCVEPVGADHGPSSVVRAGCRFCAPVSPPAHGERER